MRRTATLLASAALASGLAACGGDDPGPAPAPEAAPTGKEGEAQIRELLDAFYGPNEDAVCEIYTDEALESAGGRDACLDNEGGRVKVKYELLEVEIESDEAATALIEVASGDRLRFEIAAEDGEWKLESPPPVFIS